jgi:hypothetical protein
MRAAYAGQQRRYAAMFIKEACCAGGSAARQAQEYERQDARRATQRSERQKAGHETRISCVGKEPQSVNNARKASPVVLRLSHAPNRMSPPGESPTRRIVQSNHQTRMHRSGSDAWAGKEPQTVRSA